MKNRLLGLDVMRGLTIFGMILVNTPGSWTYVYPPLRHAEWHGWTPTDLVFPFFLFMVGVAMSYSFAKYDYTMSAVSARKVLKRTILIFLIGLLLNYFPFIGKNLAELRIMGVLQRIALAYGIGSVIVLLANRKIVGFISGFILIGYWAILYFSSSPPFELESNFARIVDLKLLGEDHLYGGFGLPFDPEGLLSTFPAAVNVLIGYLIGFEVKRSEVTVRLLQRFMVIGALLVFLAYIWHPYFPINKPLWTSSYVLLTCGTAIFLLCFLLYILDIKTVESMVISFSGLWIESVI